MDSPVLPEPAPGTPRRLRVCCVPLIVFFLLAAWGCRRSGGGGGGRNAPGGAVQQSPPVDLIFFCGAGIRTAAEKLVRAFEEREAAAGHPVRVLPTYAGSGRLLGQISATRRGDVYMPGAALYVDLAVEKGLAIAGTRRTLAWFVPVIFVRKGNPLGIHTLHDLLKPGVRVGVGDERACAVGRRTVRILARNSIDPEAFNQRVVFRSATVNELAVAVSMGSVDAAIIWDATARQFADAGEVVPIPPEQNVISAIPIVVLTSTRHRREAVAFVDFAASPEGRAIFRQEGYTVEDPTSESVRAPGGKAAGG